MRHKSQFLIKISKVIKNSFYGSYKINNVEKWFDQFSYINDLFNASGIDEYVCTCSGHTNVKKILNS